MSTAAQVIDLLTSPGTPAPTRLRLAEVVNGPEQPGARVQLALHVFDSAAAA